MSLTNRGIYQSCILKKKKADNLTIKKKKNEVQQKLSDLLNIEEITKSKRERGVGAHNRRFYNAKLADTRRGGIL